MGEVARVSHSHVLRKSTQLVLALTIAISTVGAVPINAFAAPSASASTSVENYQQCANGKPPSVSLACPSGWINGILQGSNSHYHEDDVTPQRLIVTVPKSSTNPHTVQIKYQVRKGNGPTHAYDSLATWNYTQTAADRCDGVSNNLGCGALTGPVTTGIPDDPTSVSPAGAGGNGSTITSTHMIPAGVGRQLTMYGGISFGTVTYVGTSVDSTTNDLYQTIKIPFNVDTSASARVVEILFGGHIAAGPHTSPPDRGWGTNLGASNISGGPYHIKLDMLDGSVGSKDNQIQAGGILPLGAPAFDVTKTATVYVGTTTTLRTGAAQPGDTIHYAITVTNTGTAAGSTTVTDTYDARLTNIRNITPAATSTGTHSITWTTASLTAGGGQATFSFDATIPLTFTTSPPDPTPSPYPCTSTQFDIVNDVTVTGDSAHTDTCVGAGPAFDVTKTATVFVGTTTTPRTGIAQPGDTIHYLITVTNTGSAPGSTTVTDTWDSRLTNLRNFSPTPTSQTSPTVANPITWASGTLAAGGGQATFSFDATIPLTFSGTPTSTGPCAGSFDIINTVAVTGDSAQTDTCVSAGPVFDVTKTATVYVGTTTTLRTTPPGAQPGDTIHYLITVTNTGSAPGSTTVTDTWDSRLTNLRNFSPTPTSQTSPTVANPITWASGTLAAGGGQATFSFDATIPLTFSGTPTSSGPCSGRFDIINTVTVTGDSAQTDTCVTANPAFTVTKTATVYVGTTTTLRTTPPGAQPGDTIHYVITLTNNGSAPGSTTVTDTYDARLTDIRNISPAATSTGAHSITWTSSTLAGGGGQQTFSFDATIPLTFTGPPSVTDPCHNQYDITNDVGLSIGVSTAHTDTCVTANPVFDVTKTASVFVGTTTTPRTGVAQPGDTIHYVITVTNTGSAPGSTTVTDTYDARLTNIRNINPAATSTGAHSITWTTGTLAAGGGQATFSFDATIPATFTTSPPDTTPSPYPCTSTQFDLVNDVTVTGDSAHTDTCVGAGPVFDVTKTASVFVGTTTTPRTGAAQPGDRIHYVITVTNTGSAPGSTTVTDTYDARLTNIRNITPAATSTGAHSITWTTGTLAAGGGQQAFSFDATIPLTFTGTPNPTDPCAGTFDIINDVTVTGDSAHTDTCVPANPAFTVTKTATVYVGTTTTLRTTPPGAQPGDTIHYVITVTNTGSAAGSTTVTDTYDARLTNIRNITPAATSTGAHSITWTSNTLAGGGGQQSFSFDATIPLTFTGSPNPTTSQTCPGQFDIINDVTVTGSSAHTDTCVTANPVFDVTKTASVFVGTTTTPRTGAAQPGDTIHYVITVTNTGSAPGSTTVTDTYDARLTNIRNITPAATSTGAHSITWTTGTLAAGGGQATFSFDATIPATFVGDPNPSAPCAGSFDIINDVTVAGDSAHTDTCVTAAPNLSLVKTANATGATGGSVFTYTLTYSNTGTASSEATTITETIPANTAFSACSNNCTTNGPPVTTVTWSIGSIPAGGSGSVTLTVTVLNSVGCQICNTANIQSRSFNGGVAVPSNTLCINTTPAANPAGAHASGSAFGLYVHEGILVPIDVTLSPTSSSQSGVGTNSHNNSLLNTGVPGIVNVDLLSTTSTSTVSSTTNSADQTTTAETAGLNVLNGLVTAQVVRAVATTHADGGSSRFSSIGSTIVGLQVNGVAYTNITPGLTIKLPAAVFGNGSYVAVYERTGSTSGSTSGPAAGQNSGGTYASDLTVNMIHVHITKLLLPLGGTALLDVNVSHAVAHSDFPQTTVCTPVPKQSVSGHAFIASEDTNPSILPILYGFVSIPSTGGHDFATLNTLDVPQNGSVLHLGVTDSDTAGTLGATSSDASSYAEAANVCLLKTVTGACTIGATALKSKALSTANAGGASSSDTGTTFVGLQIGGQTISLPVAPNTVINLPGLGYVVLNEQFCDNGPTPTAPGPVAPCAGATHSGLTVRAIHVVLTLPPPPGTLLGLEVIVAEAHSDATWLP